MVLNFRRYNQIRQLNLSIIYEDTRNKISDYREIVAGI